MEIKMKLDKKTTQTVESVVKEVHIKAGVRYWQDAIINNEEDTEDGVLIPCKHGDYWCPIIDIETGVIKNWTQGVKADIHYKVCDDFGFSVKDADGNEVLNYDGYVVDFMYPEEDGFGDYIIMKVDENGKIDKWDNSYFNSSVEAEF